MDEVKRVLTVLKSMQIDHENHRDSKIGRFLAAQGDEVSLDSFDVYFNHSTTKEQIDFQVGNHIFNFCEWTPTMHKLAELLLLKGARVEDVELLGQRFNTFNQQKTLHASQQRRA